jgi:putative membrane protein
VENPPEAEPKASLADYLAAERTLLAWIRTGLALMGFGFVLARFALMLAELHVMQNGRAVESSGFSLWSGTALIVVGVIVNAFAGWHHLRMVRVLDVSDKAYSRPSMLAVGIAFFLGLVGLAMAIYLILASNSTHS